MLVCMDTVERKKTKYMYISLSRGKSNCLILEGVSVWGGGRCNPLLGVDMIKLVVTVLS